MNAQSLYYALLAVVIASIGYQSWMYGINIAISYEIT